MTNDEIPTCQGPDPKPTKAKFNVPPGTVDSHAHIFGPSSKYPYSPKRGYTPPDASLTQYQKVLQALGGIERAVLTQPSVYGVDNSCMLDAVAQMDGKFRAVAAVNADVADKELEGLHARGVRGARVNIVDKGGMPFDGIEAVQKFTQRIKPLGWHLEVLVHVHQFEDLRGIMNAMAVDVVFGHLGYMKSDNPVSDPGFQDFLNLLRDGNAWVKFSGSYRITTSRRTPYDDVAPIAHAIVEANQDRIIWGTDWPHPFFKGEMPNDGALMDHLHDWASDETVRNKILVDNPEQLYGFAPSAH